MKMLNGFKQFLLKQNVFALATGVVIGGAVSKFVSAIVDDLVMPIVGLILPPGDWRTAELTLTAGKAIKYGDLLGRLVDFVVVALVVFLLVKYIFRLEGKAAPTKRCPACLESIPEAARKCKACGESQA